MINDNYKLRYLPLFFDDVNSITSYIKNELTNPKAANDLIDAEGADKIMEVRRLLFNRRDREKLV